MSAGRLILLATCQSKHAERARARRMGVADLFNACCQWSTVKERRPTVRRDVVDNVADVFYGIGDICRQLWTGGIRRAVWLWRTYALSLSLSLSLWVLLDRIIFADKQHMTFCCVKNVLSQETSFRYCKSSALTVDHTGETTMSSAHHKQRSSTVLKLARQQPRSALTSLRIGSWT